MRASIIQPDGAEGVYHKAIIFDEFYKMSDMVLFCTFTHIVIQYQI